MYRVCVDVGGTFTDCLVLDPQGRLRQFKAPTTPPDPSLGFMDALAKAARAYGEAPAEFLRGVEALVHGTTLATNTLINQDGARTGMLTTEGFRDVIEIRRGYKNVRRSMYDVFVPPYEPLVPRRRRLSVAERTLSSGEVLTPLDEEAVGRAAGVLAGDRVESVAVCFLHSWANPANERRAAELARAALPGAYVTASHEILPVWREYERFSTTVVSAYVGPRVERYLRTLCRRLAEGGFHGNLLLMLSSALVDTEEHCISRAVALIGSGPAAAPAGALFVGERAGRRELLSIDMGGTSLDVCLITEGRVPTTTEGWVGEERVALKSVDIHSAGAGGGSIAWVDQVGLLRVGPRSAGADPGPACYGKGGTEPTATDAALLLGYIPADYFLGGEMPLDAGRAERAVGSIAARLGLSARDAAAAIFATVNAYMASEITEVSTMRGHDVRDFALVVGGGAGPVHGPFLAELLGIPTVIVPAVASTYSAFGMFAMDLGRDSARSHVARGGAVDPGRVGALYEEMEGEARAALAASRADPGRTTFARTAEVRYVGQFHEVEVEVDAGPVTRETLDEAVRRFHRRHEELYTFGMPWKEVEFLTFRVRATVPRAAFELAQVGEGGRSPDQALKHHRRCRFGAADVRTPVYDGACVRAGNVISGPAVVEEATTTVVVPPGFDCAVDRWKNYVLTASGRQA